MIPSADPITVVLLSIWLVVTPSTLTVLAPALLVAAPLAWRAAATTAGPAVLLALLPKLLERAVRDTSDAHLSTVLPGLEVVDQRGRVVPREELGPIDQARTELTIGASLLFHVTYELSVRCLGVGGWTAMLGAGAVEGMRVLAGSYAIEAAAQEHQSQVRMRAGGGWARLRSNLGAMPAWRQAADSGSIRETIGLLRDSLDVWVGTPTSPIAIAACAILRAEAKTVAEARAWLVTLAKAAQAAARTAPTVSEPRFGDDIESPREIEFKTLARQGAQLQLADEVDEVEEHRQVVVHLWPRPPTPLTVDL